jgi:hypothetical protein
LDIRITDKSTEIEIELEIADLDEETEDSY